MKKILIYHKKIPNVVPIYIRNIKLELYIVKGNELNVHYRTVNVVRVDCKRFKIIKKKKSPVTRRATKTCFMYRSSNE